jgi:phosphatidylglycerophosphate synthase
MPVPSEAGHAIDAALAGAPPVPAARLAMRVDGSVAAARAERALFQSVPSKTDGVIDRWVNRPLGRPLARWLVRTPVTPNQVTVVSIAIGLAAAACFASGSPPAAIAGALLFQLTAIVDCIDGAMARAGLRESSLGEWLDMVGDQVVHVALFGGIGVGLWRAGHGGELLVLGGVTVAGVIVSFLVVKDELMRRTAPGPRLQRYLEHTANRDFSCLILAAAVFGRLDALLWVGAFGIQGFWIVALVLKRSEGSRAPGAVARAEERGDAGRGGAGARRPGASSRG